MAIYIQNIQVNDIDTIWEKIQPSIPINIEVKAKKLLKDWIESPSTNDINLEEKAGKSPLYYAFEKKFISFDELLHALIGNARATNNLEKEESFAFSVLATLAKLRIFVLDELIDEVGNHFESLNKTRSFDEIASDQAFLDNHWFGPLAQLEWKKGWQQVKNNALSGDAIEQLYKIVTLINQYNWPRPAQDNPKKITYRLGPTPGRDQFAASKTMRRDAWTLDESHQQVIYDRNHHIPVWGGTSGSAMDMIHTAKQLGIVDPMKLTAFAYCIAAYFHFAPTKYVVHTFHEVMRGAKIVAPEIQYNPADAAAPSQFLLNNLFNESNIANEKNQTQSTQHIKLFKPKSEDNAAQIQLQLDDRKTCVFIG